MYKVVLLDFNGVVVDDEGYQEQLYIEVLADRGLDLTPAAYQENFLGKDDYSIGRTALAMSGQEPTLEDAKALVAEKTRRYVDTIADNLRPVAGANDFVKVVRESALLGIVSGAPRAEIEHVLALMGIQDPLDVFVPLERFDRGKPDPQGYLLALAELNHHLAKNSRQPISPAETLVVEDSRSGFAAGKAAGMGVAALTTSHPPETFPGAVAHSPNLEELLPWLKERLHKDADWLQSLR